MIKLIGSSKRYECYDWWKNFFDHPIKNDIRTQCNISKLMPYQGNGYSGCLLDYSDFRK